MANPKNSPFFDDILEAEELAEEEAKAKVKADNEADDEVGIRAKNIDIKKMFSSEKALYFVGEHNSEEIIIRISFENIERVKKKVGGVFK